MLTRPELHAFALDSQPLSQRRATTKTTAGTVIIDGHQHFSLTLPVRKGAAFSGAPLTSNTIDGLVYRILADDDLIGNDLSASETQTDTTTLPPLCHHSATTR